MARPPNQHVAAKKARELLSRRLPGLDPTTVREHVVRAEHVAQAIWRRWQVGPYQWQVKHLRWYLEHRTEGMRPGTRYRHWLTVRALAYALGRSDDWLGHLRGTWLRPTSDDAELNVGRPPSLPI
jgi:hypothetical protein